MRYKTPSKSHQHWNDCKYQIHWNKLEWVVPISRNVKKTRFCTSSHKFYIKDRDYTNHLVGHSLMTPIDVD